MHLISFTPETVQVIAPVPNWNGTLTQLATRLGLEQSALVPVLPDDYFRAAWKFVSPEVVIDIDRAKEIQRDHWRDRREPLLEALDVQFMRALEENDAEEQARIAAEKQALRDVTETALPNDPAAIKATWPEILGPR